MENDTLKLLIIDDSVLIGNRICSMLSDINNLTIVGQAVNSLEADKIIEHEIPDVIILDIELPGKNGIEILTDYKLKNYKSKIIIFTNYTDPFCKNECDLLGADYFLDKSNEFEKLPLIIKRMAS